MCVLVCADSLPAWDSVQLAQYPVVGYASAVKGWLMHLREPLFPNALVSTLLGLDIGARLACACAAHLQSLRRSATSARTC